MTFDPSKDPNHLFMVRLKKGEVGLRVLLSKKLKPRQVTVEDELFYSQGRSNQFMEMRRPEDEIIPKRGGRGILFYDLGQIKNESDAWVDIDFSFEIDITVTNGVPTPTRGNPTLATIEPFNDMVLAVPPEDLTTYFRRLEYAEAEKYGLDIIERDGSNYATAGVTNKWAVGRSDTRYYSEDDDNNLINGSAWKSGGLEVPDELQYVSMVSWGAFRSLHIHDSVVTKVTTEPLYSADAVTDFRLHNKADVFLVPDMPSQYVFAGNGSTEIEYLFGLGRQLEREFWLDRVFEDTGYPLLSRPLNQTGGSIDLGGGYDVDFRTGYLNYLRNTGDEYIYVGGVWTQNAGTVFPTYSPVDGFITHFSSGNRFPEGALAGIIQQQGTTYYFWNALSSVQIFFPWRMQREVEF